MLLTAYSYYGQGLPVSAAYYHSTLSPLYLSLGALSWAAVLNVADIMLLRKVYLRHVEEQRVF